MSAQQLFDESRGYADGWVQSADNLVRGFEHDLNVLRAEGRSAQLAIDGMLLSPEAIGRLSLVDDYNVTQRLQTQIDKSSDLLDAEGIGDVDFEPTPLWDGARLPAPVVFDADAFKVDPFNGIAPSVSFGTAPARLTTEAPARPAGLQTVVIPTDFPVDTPTAPALSAAVDLPSAPVLVFPAYLEAIDWGEVGGLQDPDFTFSFNEQAYQSAMMDGLKAKLMGDLVSGGYGIETGDEAGLWERARDREAASSGAEVQALARDFASRGFMVPPGAMFGALEGIRSKALDAAATLSRDVALKRADLYVQNRQFTIQQVKELETLLLNQHMAVMERILRAAQVSAQFVVDQYRARLDKTRLAVDVIQARVQSFRELVAAESAKVAIYNAQISAELAKTEVDKNKLEAYRAALSGVESTVNVYRLQVQAAEAAIQAERSKVEMWKAEVDGYLATVKAKESEFSGYEAQIRGEQAKVQAFGEQVKAHAAIVDAKRVEADIKNLEVRSYAESASIALRVFEAELEANKSANDLLSRADENAVRALGAKVNAYQAGVSAAGKLADTNLDQSRLMLQSKLDASKIMLQSMIASIDTGLKYTTMEFDSKQKMVDMYKDMITAALGGLNSIASISE